MLKRESFDLRNQYKNCCKYFQRKRAILDYFCTRLKAQSKNCLIDQPVNMTVMLLRLL